MTKDPNCLYSDAGEMFTEFPFFYDGIPAGEFEKEQEYFFEHFLDYKRGKYKSLRQQGYFKN